MSQNIHFVHDHSILMPYCGSLSCHGVHLLCGIASVLGVQIVGMVQRDMRRKNSNGVRLGMRARFPPLSFSTSYSLFFPILKRTDSKLLLLEISRSLKKSKSQNCSSVGCLKCVQFRNWLRSH